MTTCHTAEMHQSVLESLPSSLPPPSNAALSNDGKNVQSPPPQKKKLEAQDDVSGCMAHWPTNQWQQTFAHQQREPFLHGYHAENALQHYLNFMVFWLLDEHRSICAQMC